MYPFRECRERAGLSQKAAALSLHVKPPSVSDWETGKTKPTIENLLNMADLYKTNLNVLLGRTTENESGKITELCPEEKKLIEDFRLLNQQGKEYLLQTMAMAVRIYISGQSVAVPEMENSAK